MADGNESPEMRQLRERLARLMTVQRKLEPAEVMELRAVYPAILDVHLPELVRRFQRVGLDEADAEDVALEALDRTFFTLVDKGFRKPLGEVVNKTAKGCFLNFIRARKRCPLSVGLPPSSRVPPKTPLEIERALDLLDLYPRLRDAVTDEQWEVAQLIGVLGLSAREAAVVLEIPVGTVYSRWAAAKEALAKVARRWLPPSQRPQDG